MPTQIELRAQMSKKLQDYIQHTDPDVSAGRKSAIKRWVGVLHDNYMDHIKYFKNDKLQFLRNVFQDESCWSGVRLNNAVLGQRLTEEKIDGINNPLRKYEMACSYCVVDKIHLLFQKRFESYRNKFPPGAFDGKTETEIARYVRNSLLDSIKRKGPVFDFWIDRESGEFKEYEAVEGFDSAVKLEWSEGVEYFYNHLKEEDKEKKLTEAILALSRPNCVEKGASILDFCVRNITDKDTLLQKLLQKDKAVFSLLAELTESCLFDTVHDLVRCWCYKEVSAEGGNSQKILSQRNYELLLSSLSDTMLKNPESSVQARSCIMEIWECGSLAEHKKASIIDTSNDRVPIKIVLGDLIVNWKRENIAKFDEEKEIEKKEILDMVSFAKNSFPDRFGFFKEKIIESLRLCGREGKRVNVDYGNFAEELFSELEKPTLPIGPGGDGPCSNLRSRSKAHGSKKTTLPLDGSDDAPQSVLEAPGSSRFSGRSK